MTTFFSALTTIVLPILLVTLAGVLLRRSGLIVDSRPMARLALYLLSPALVLDSISRSRLSDSDLIALALYALVIAAVMGVISLGLARLLRFDRLLTSAFLLSIIFVNAGNIGLPFNQFAYGDSGLSRATVFFVVNALLTQTVAVFIASSGRRGV
ncbi:MAG: AEC family transporter, partial [Rudaea sp.]